MNSSRHTLWEGQGMTHAEHVWLCALCAHYRPQREVFRSVRNALSMLDIASPLPGGLVGLSTVSGHFNTKLHRLGSFDC